MAPLLTAVILAGRSGAAFAAEIGSMKLNQELDALEVMDFDISGFLVLPRVFALAAAGPLLTLLADAAGIIGGMVTSRVVLGLPVVSFIQEIQKALSPADLYTGIIKGLSFAALIGLTGCYCGLRTRMTAGSVGIQTTTAVVSGILLIILADGLYAGIFQMLGW
jgi:phospholipid/cholesterol/gamma-HCH transport system permease protein